MQFRSDNTAPCPPQVIMALQAANSGHMASYGGDDLSHQASGLIRKVLDAPEAEVFFVSSGSAANSLALANLVHPYAGIYAHASAHINTEEGGAPEFYSGGAKIHGITGAAGKLTPAALHQRLLMTGNNFPHEMPRGALSMTNLTELGSRYSVAETKALSSIAREFDLPLHLDGARFANAVVGNKDTAADMTWRAGVDTLVFGGTKLGAMAVEAVVIFDPRRARDFSIRLKRGGHLLSKSRYLAAQFIGLLQDDLWLELAGHANAAACQLAQALARQTQVSIEVMPEGNIIFATWPRGLHQRLIAAGAQYYLEPFWQQIDGDPDELLCARLVTSWATHDDEISQFLRLF